MLNAKLKQALVLIKRGLVLVSMKGKVFFENSRGPLDEISDEEAVKTALDRSTETNLFVKTGTCSDVAVLRISVSKLKSGEALFNSVQSLRKLLDGTGIDIGSEVMKHLKSHACNRDFLLWFKLDGKKLPTRMALLPGVDFFGEYGCVPTPPSVYREGRCEMEHVWDAQGDEPLDPERDYLGELLPLPEWTEKLSQIESPFNAVWARSITQDEAIDQCLEGFSGESAQKDLHNALCVLRGHGVEKDPFLKYARLAAEASGDEITEEWANECAWHIWLRYEPVNRSLIAEQGKQALMDTLEV